MGFISLVEKPPISFLLIVIPGSWVCLTGTALIYTDIQSVIHEHADSYVTGLLI